MSNSDTTGLNLPTADDVRHWQRELESLFAEEAAMKERHAAEEKALKDRRSKLNRLVTAAAAFLDVDVQSPQTEKAPEPAREVPPDRPTPRFLEVKRPKDQSWRATILRVVEDADRGVTHQEVREALSKTHLAETLKRTDKAFYGGIARLVKAGKLIKHNNKIYNRKAFRQFKADVAAGRIVDKPAQLSSERGSPNIGAILGMLAAAPNGLPSKKIMDSLLRNPPSPDVSRNRGSLFNALARLKDKGTVIKRGDRYYLARSEGETPDSTESGGSHNHGDEGGTSSSSGGTGNGALRRTSSLVAFPGYQPGYPGKQARG